MGQTTPEGQPDPDLKALHRRGWKEFQARLQAVRDDQWDLPTPCTEWNVRDLVHHMVYESEWVAPLLAGSTIEEVGDRFEGDLLGDDPRAAWEEAGGEELRAVESTTSLDYPVHVSWGQISAEEFVFERAVDLLIHAWDLARAIGAEERLDHEAVDLCYRRLKPHEDRLKASGLFGPKVDPPPGADRQTELLAVLGRIG